jgi:hypothetical protein
MKIKYTIFIALAIVLGLGSCKGYLDIVPDNVATIDYSFRNRTVAEKYLFTCYSYRPTSGGVNVDPAMNGCDETWIFYGNNAPWNNTQIQRGFQTSVTPFLNFWDGEAGGKKLWNGIRDCNIFLENVASVRDLPDYEMKRWIAEVKFLKAYYHYYLFKCYGPIPIMDVNLPISASVEEVQVYRETVDNVVKYITNLMKEAAVDLPEAGAVVEGTEAGRADKLVALAMRAEVLLFAASPLYNGNTDYASMRDKSGAPLFSQTYDANKWKLAADACKQAIDTCLIQKKGLFDVVDPFTATAPTHFKIETTFRQAVCERWNKELIWGNTNYDCTYLSRQAQAKVLRLNAELSNNVFTEWAPTLKMAEKFYSKNGVPIEEDVDWQNNAWYENRYKVRPVVSSGEEIYYVQKDQKTAYLHFYREPRFYASLGFDKGVYFGNGYYTWPGNVKYTDFLNKQVSGAATASGNFSITGYSVKKMHSFKNAQTASSTSVEYFPFPVLRLADLYLMYAEALNEFGGPNAEIFNYLDQVRARAGLKGVKESWATFSTKPNKPDTKDGLRQIIQQERTIELAFEGKRFWDIRRWKKIDELNEQPRGWNISGETTDDFYNLVPVAQVPVKFTVKDYFWPIKESDLTVNKNLIQNYGW